MSEITDNLKHFLKVQSLQFDQARIQATKQADDLGITQFEPRAELMEVQVISDMDRNAFAIKIYFRVLNIPDPVVLDLALKRLR